MLATQKEDTLLSQASDSAFTFRRLAKSDYEKGFLPVLSQLTKGCEYSQQEFNQRFDEIFLKENDVYKIIVIEDNVTKQIIGAGTIFFELKFIRNAGKCGHIEDIVVDKK